MASVLSRLDIPALNFEQVDSKFDVDANFLDFTSATYVESELSEQLDKQEPSNETSRLANEELSAWAKSCCNLDSEPPEFDAVDAEIYRLMQDPQSDQTLVLKSEYSATLTHENDWLVKSVARLAETAKMLDLFDKYDKFVSECIYDTSGNSIEATDPASETHQRELDSVRCQESPSANLSRWCQVQEPELLSQEFHKPPTTDRFNNIRFEDENLENTIPPCLSLSSDMEQFSPFGQTPELPDVGVDPDLLTLRDIPSRPWLNGLELAEMNYWQRDELLQVIGYEQNATIKEARLGGEEPSYNESEIDPGLFNKNGNSLSGGTNLLCHPIYGICMETMAKSAALKCISIPEVYGDKPRVVSKPELHMNDQIERRYLASLRKKKEPELGVPLPTPEPKYLKNSPIPSDCLFMNFRVKPLKPVNRSLKLLKNASPKSIPTMSTSFKSTSPKSRSPRCKATEKPHS